MRQIEHANIPLPRLQAWMDAREASIRFIIRRYMPIALRLLKWVCVLFGTYLAGWGVFDTVCFIVYGIAPSVITVIGWIGIAIYGVASVCADDSIPDPALGRSRFADTSSVQQSNIWQP